MPHDAMVQGPLAGDEPAKPGIFGGALNALFPTEGYEGLIDPDQLRGEQNLALRRAGLSLLANAGPRPRSAGPRNFGADLAQALDPAPWQQRLGQVAQQSATIGAMQRKAQQEAQASEIARRPEFQPRAGETDIQRDARLNALIDAFQQAGLMEYAQETATLRNTARAPGLTERNGKLYDHWGRYVADVPGYDAGGVAGAQLYSTSEKRINQFAPVSEALTVLDIARKAQPMAGQKLDPAVSGAFLDSAKRILGVHTSIAEDETNPSKALANAVASGHLGRFLSALIDSGTGTITVAQRDQVLSLVDAVLADLAAEQTRVDEDIRRIFTDRWKDNPAMLNSMLSSLPVVRRIAPGTQQRTGANGTSQERMDQMRRVTGRP